MTDRAASPAWRDLQEHAAEIESLHLRQLFSDDAGRFGQFSLGQAILGPQGAENRGLPSVQPEVVQELAHALVL